MKLTVLTRYGDLGASSRMRTHQYVPHFRRAGIDTRVVSLFQNEDLAHRYENGSYGIARVIDRCFRRTMALWRDRSDIIWVEKELIPWMPAWFERFLFNGRPYVMDFDDAVFHNYDQHRFGVVRSLLGRKIDSLMKRSKLIIAGNEYLAERATLAGCPRVEIVPTVIDLDRYTAQLESSVRNTDLSDEIVIGWIGSPYTTKYLEMLRQPLARLARQQRIRFRVIGGRPIDFSGVKIESLPWRESEESQMLSQCDIGVMPLPNSHWERGKCGYKLIQYMVCSKPVVGSPIGVNTRIIQPDNGFLCESESEWHDSLLQLCRDPELRIRLGHQGRACVEEQYCIQKTAPRVIKLLQDIAG